jgi:hypothetical protein
MYKCLAVSKYIKTTYDPNNPEDRIRSAIAKGRLQYLSYTSTEEFKQRITKEYEHAKATLNPYYRIDDFRRVRSSITPESKVSALKKIIEEEFTIKNLSKEDLRIYEFGIPTKNGIDRKPWLKSFIYNEEK